MIEALTWVAWGMFLGVLGSTAGLFWVVLFRWLVSPPRRKS